MTLVPDDAWPPPPAPRSGADEQGRTTILGGLPPADDPAWSSLPRTGREPVLVPSGVQVATDSFFSEPADADPFSWRSLRARIDRLVRKSPPLTISISLHVVALVMLAVWMVRREPVKVPTLEIAFRIHEPAEEPGVSVEKEPEKKTEPEPVPADLPVVPNPVASPPPLAADTPGPAVAGDARVPAPVVGALLQGREVGRRETLLQAFGGTPVTEEAVSRALDWIARQLRPTAPGASQAPTPMAARRKTSLRPRRCRSSPCRAPATSPPRASTGPPWPAAGNCSSGGRPPMAGSISIRSRSTTSSTPMPRRRSPSASSTA